MGGNRHGRGSTQHPAGELDAVAAHVLQGTSAALLHVPEPFRVRAEVPLRLFDEVNFSQRSLLHQLSCPNVLGSEDQFLGVQQMDAGSLARLDHAVGFRQIHAEGFFAYHVFAGFRGRHGRFAVQVVGQAQRNHVHIRKF